MLDFEKVMKIEREYPVIGKITVQSTGRSVDIPICEIKLMSDERWQELAIENAVHNYIRENGREPESIEQALQWHRSWIDSRLVI